MKRAQEPMQYNCIIYNNGVRTTLEEMQSKVFVNRHADILAKYTVDSKFSQTAQVVKSN